MGIALAVAILLPFRHTLSVDGAALVLVIPVVQVVAIGGFWAIPFGVVAGFLAYDFFFLPPYGPFRVGRPETSSVLSSMPRLASRRDRGRPGETRSGRGPASPGGDGGLFELHGWKRVKRLATMPPNAPPDSNWRLGRERFRSGRVRVGLT